MENNFEMNYNIDDLLDLEKMKANPNRTSAYRISFFQDHIQSFFGQRLELVCLNNEDILIFKNKENSEIFAVVEISSGTVIAGNLNPFSREELGAMLDDYTLICDGLKD